MGIRSKLGDIKRRLELDCYGLLDRVSLYGVSKYGDYRNGIAFDIRFRDVVEDMGQFEIADTSDNLLQG